jgi:TonB-linked SusC/RagA family outer membrane protein
MKQKKYFQKKPACLKILFFLVCLLTGYAGTAQTITGKVVDEQGIPVIGATVVEKGTNNGTTTNVSGEFSITDVPKNAKLVISSVGFEKQEIKLSGKSEFTITLKKKTNQLDETVIRAYGTTTRRLNTGDISTVTAKEIAQQPVSNPLAALEGRVPGLVVTQSNGVPGSGFSVQIRGQNSIAQGSEPLFIIDGVPYAPGNNFTNQFISAAGPNSQTGLSPFSVIDPSNIQSIEVLKDADATAIYGSRGANGVILITTKKGVPGKTRVSVNVYSGLSRITRFPKILNTSQYLEMRREAFKNDSIAPDVNSAPDLLSWDTTRYTDFKKLLIGGTAHSTNVNVSVSGGSQNTQFLLSSGYHRQTTVFPGNLSDVRSGLHLNLNHHSENKKFSLNLSAGYSNENNNINSLDLTSYVSTPPDFPPLYDSSGNLNWEGGGVALDNPLAYLRQTYSAKTDNLLGNLRLDYKVLSSLTLKVNLGYNAYQLGEVSLHPSTSVSPSYFGNPIYSNFANNSFKDWIIEPQIEYSRNISKGKLDILVGGSWQQTINNSSMIQAEGFANDALIKSISAAGSIIASSSASEYRYVAVFGRLNYNWQNKYILDLSGRRDGSSRFGPGRQFANFMAAGGAWIFIDENENSSVLPFLSFGKLRVSYGTTGNDQIAPYAYLNAWNPSGMVYDGVNTLYPSSLFNPDYSWEVNRKFGAGMNLGFLKDHILLEVSYFRNRCSNQLINYSLPSQTGFTSILQNFPALVQNTGWEFSLTTENINTGSFNWSSTFNLSIPKNELVAFPGIENSSYTNLIIGQPLSVISGFHFLGVDPETGVYQFAAQDGKPTTSPSITNDWKNNLGNLDPEFYGGIINNISFKSWQLTFFFEFRKQKGKNYLFNEVFPPGSMFNEPVSVLDRWQAPGESTTLQKFTSNYGTPAYSSFLNLANSDAQYTDASFIRLKNVSLSYSLSALWLKKVSVENCRFYLQAQNLFVITGYKGSDPETQSFQSLPPLRTIVGGFQITF